MTQGIVSIKLDGAMVFKLVTGHDGMNAVSLAARLRGLGRIPTLHELEELAIDYRFGCRSCLVVIERDPEHFFNPMIHTRGGEIDHLDPEMQRYRDTFHVPQFNPRWKYGTADYVEVVEFSSSSSA